MSVSSDSQAAEHLGGLLEHVARISGFTAGQFEVVGDRTIRHSMDMDGTQLRVLDLRGPEGVAYRARCAYEGETLDDVQVLLDVIVGQGHLADERPVTGPMSHEAARTAAMNYNRYMAALA